MSVFNCAGCDVLVYDLTYSDPTPPHLCQQCGDLALVKAYEDEWDDLMENGLRDY